MSETSGIKFRPVMGTEELIKNTTQSNGYFYIATDSGSMYLDVDNHRISVGGVAGGGGSSSFVWANGDDETIVKANEDDADTTYIIDISIIDGGVKPRPDSLILNADGRFFRVSTEESEQEGTVLANLIAVSGSGGGGGAVSTQEVFMSYDNSTIDSGATYVYGQKTYAKFSGYSTIDPKVRFIFTIEQKGNLISTLRSDLVNNNDEYLFDLSQLPKGNNITLTVRIESANMSMAPTDTRLRRIFGDISTVELKINKDPNFNATQIKSGESTISFSPSPNTLAQTLHVVIDGSELDLNIDTTNRNYLNWTPTSGTPVSINLPALDHGNHTVEMFVTSVINGETLSSESISYDLAWKDNESAVPIIWLGDYDTTVIQYNECIIPFMIYNPVNEGATVRKSSVYLYHNGTQIPTSPIEAQYDAMQWIKWDVSDLVEAAPGAGKENVFAITCGSTTRRISIWVTSEGARDLNIVSGDLLLNLTSTGRSNQESSNTRGIWSYTNRYNTTYNTTFTDFNWYNNGWLNDEDGNGAYLSIANGAKATINLDTFTLNGNDSYTFEIRFRVRNIQEYSTLIKTIPYYYVNENNSSWTVEQIAANHYTYKKDEDGNTIMDKASPKNVSTTGGVIFKYLNNQGYGFCIGTQEAYFRTPDSIANVRYKEDEIINLSFVIQNHNLMSIYLNGILSGALNLASTALFQMDNDKFEITSEFCDVDIYKLRIYRGALGMPEIIHNYISDIHSVTLYDQNQLTNDNDGTILEYSKLLEYNEKYPDNQSMPYAVWEIIDNGAPFNDPNDGQHGADDDKLPYFKGNDRYCKITFVNPCLDRALEKGEITEDFYYTHSPSFEAIGAGINVQGTSSQAYPRRNFKTKLKSATNLDKNKQIIPNKEDWKWVYTKGSRAGQQIKKWNMDNANCATNKFTWKIDYMESSGSYNTGFANLVGNMYNYHPLSKYPAFDNDGTGYRTSVYGFPVLVFHKHSTTADKALTEEQEYQAYEYIGRYNFNLDKSSNEYYGFELENEHPYTNDGRTVAEVAECWELRDNQGTWTSFKYADPSNPDFNALTNEGTQEFNKHFEVRYNCEGDQIEYAQGVATAAELGYDDTTAIKMFDGSRRDLSTQANKNEYLKEKYSNLKALFDWLASTDTTNVPETDTGVPLAEPATFNNTVYYMVETVRENGQDVAYYVDAEGNQLVKVSDVVDVDANKFYVYMQNDENIMTRAIAANDYTGAKRAKDDTLITYNTDCAGYRLKKFIKEFNDHLDLEYCLIYFIMTELLLCYDSRGKNMMIATWGPNKVGGSYIWFPIFYDIDTQLGLNNIGAVLWDYDTDASMQGTFSTANSVLWQNFFAGFRREIEEKYRALRKASRLTETTIEGAYLCDPDVFTTSYAMRGVRPVIAIGLDEWYKYIAPGINKSTWYTGTDRRFGYYVSSFEQGQQKTTDASYVYTCQGDRKLSRELFIRNRLNYVDSWWLAGAYDSTSSGYKTEIMIRANANDTSTSDTYLDQSKVANNVPGYQRVQYPQKFYDAIPEFTITPFLSQYVTVFYDEDPLTPTIKYDGINPVLTHTTPAVANGYKAIYPYNEQLTYIPGGDYVSDLGDLSLKYPSHFKLNTGKRLTQLLIGSDAPDYANGIIGKESGTFDLNDAATGTNKKGLLQKIVLTGLTALAEGQNVSGSEKLREFRALNTQIPSVTFAEGAPLDTVHLPKSIAAVNIVHAKNLNNILTDYPVVMEADAEEGYKYVDHDEYKGLYIERLTDYKASDENYATEGISQVATINLTDVKLGYDSYTLLKNAVDIRERFRPTGFLALNFEDVEWTPYKVIETDTPYDSTKTFYRLTDHSTFVEYDRATHSADNWNLLKLNKKIFTYEPTEKESLIQDINLLKLMVEDYKTATNVASNHYRNTRGLETKTYPNITGTIYISNASGTAIPEDDPINGYGIEQFKQYYPNLTIYAANVVESYIVKYIYRMEDGHEQQIDLKRYNKSITHPNSITTEKFIRNNYDFNGWCLEDPLINPNAEVVLVYNPTEETYTTTETWDNLTFDAQHDTYVLYAKYTETYYNITFHMGDLPNEVIPCQYSHFVTVPVTVPYKSEANLPDNKKYAFLGFAKSATASTALNMSEEVVIKEMDYYPIFKEVDVHSNPLDDKYLAFIGPDPFDDRDNNTVYGFHIGLNTAYTLQGKITLPTTHTVNGVTYPVCGIQSSASSVTSNGFSHDNDGKNKITHIYWDDPENAQVYTIDQNAFRGCRELKYLEVPPSVHTLGIGCFVQSSCNICSQLQNIKRIYQGAFSSLVAPVTSIHISSTTIEIQGGAFNYMSSLTDLTLGAPNDPTKVTGITSYIVQSDTGNLTCTVYTDNPDDPQWPIAFQYANYLNIIAV